MFAATLCLNGEVNGKMLVIRMLLEAMEAFGIQDREPYSSRLYVPSSFS